MSLNCEIIIQLMMLATLNNVKTNIEEHSGQPIAILEETSLGLLNEIIMYFIMSSHSITTDLKRLSSPCVQARR